MVSLMKWLIPLVAFVAWLPRSSSADTTLGTAITAVPYTITTPGVYYFTKDLAFTPASGIAITVEAIGVVIDLNGHQLFSAAGSATTAAGIFCDNYNRVSIKDGTVLGFENGVVVVSAGATIADLLVIDNFKSGITLIGDYAQISGNRVCTTGSSTATSVVSAVGISLTGTYCTVTNNDVQDTLAKDVAGHSADGILIKDCSNVVVSNNRVLNVQPSTPTEGGLATGIGTVASSNLVVLGNIVLEARTGFDLSGGASGKYGDNTTGTVLTTYDTSGSGMTGIGGNN